ncbi:MAG: aminomethyl transferase family protein [Gemmatimonadetes bacterium]|nr:MAG: aminomethyl transferase family protein [Gemmatimonadota bacterium]
MKKTPLHSTHQHLHATFTEQNGWQIPAHYGSVTAEYHALVEDVGVIDVSTLGKFRATGKDALGLLNRLSTNNLMQMEPFHAMSTVLTTEKGRIVDLLIVLKSKKQELLALTSPHQIETDLQWIENYTFPLDDAHFENVTDSFGCLLIAGFSAVKVLSDLAGKPVEEWSIHQFDHTSIDHVPCTLMRTSDLSVPAYYLICPAEYAPLVWSAVVANGATPVGDQAYQTLRIETGLPVGGYELTKAVNPLEAGLHHAISFNKGCYVGQEVVARVDSSKKIKHSLYGLRLEGDQLPAPQDKIYTETEKEIGFITSSVRSIKLQQLVALGYIKNRDFTAGMDVIIRSQTVIRAKTSTLPF